MSVVTNIASREFYTLEDIIYFNSYVNLIIFLLLVDTREPPPPRKYASGAIYKTLRPSQ